MKTQPMKPLLAVRDDLLLTEEVLVRVPQKERRYLLGHAVTLITSLKQAGVPFEMRRLNQDLLASFDGTEFSANPEVVALVNDLSGFLDQFANNLYRAGMRRAQAEAQESPTQSSQAEPTEATSG